MTPPTHPVGTGTKVLVVFFSRTGKSRSVAETVAERLGAAVEEIDARGAFSGFASYFHGIHAAWRREVTPVAPSRHDPEDFDLVVLVGPLWAGGISCPVRGYLAKAAPGIGRYAAFITSTEGKPGRAFRQLSEIIGREPVATGSAAVRDVLGGTWDERVDGFVLAVERALGT